MKIVVCAVLMLLVNSNCTAEMPPMMAAAQMEHAAEHAGQAKAIAKCAYDPCNPGRHSP